MSNLLDEVNRQAYIDDIDEEYKELCEDHYDSLKERKYLSYADAKANKFKIDFACQPSPIPPTFLGRF